MSSLRDAAMACPLNSIDQQQVQVQVASQSVSPSVSPSVRPSADRGRTASVSAAQQHQQEETARIKQ